MCLTYPFISNVMCKNLYDMTFWGLVIALQNAYIIPKNLMKQFTVLYIYIYMYIYVFKFKGTIYYLISHFYNRLTFK